jgi:hypothetical protein
MAANNGSTFIAIVRGWSAPASHEAPLGLPSA